MSDRGTKLFLFATITPKPDFYNNIRESLQSIIIPTLEESGCQMFTQFDNLNKSVLYLFEIFDNQIALDSHYESNYVKNIFANYQEWLAKPVEIIKLTPGSLITEKQFEKTLTPAIE